MSPLRRRIAPDLRIVVSGGAALKPEVGWKLEGLGWLVATGYGLTETAPLLTISRPGNLRFDTAGHPVPGVDLRIDREAAPHGVQDKQDTGEVLARGPGGMLPILSCSRTWRPAGFAPSFGAAKSSTTNCSLAGSLYRRSGATP